MIRRDLYDEFLEFVLQRARDDERRGRLHQDEGLVDVAEMAQAMVRRLRERYAGAQFRAWTDVLRRFVEPHAGHPDFRPEWRRDDSPTVDARGRTASADTPSGPCRGPEPLTGEVRSGPSFTPPPSDVEAQASPSAQQTTSEALRNTITAHAEAE